MATATRTAGESDVSILARVLGGERGQLSHELARYLLGLSFSERDRDRDRMHDLAVRNQADALSPEEHEELKAFGRAGDLLAVIKSKARRTLGVKPTGPPIA